MLRLVNLVVIAGLVAAAAYVYKIKFDSTLQAERVAKVRREIQHERDVIAALRAQWARLDNPHRIQVLAQRHLALKPIVATQFEDIGRLPERPPQLVPLDSEDPIASLIENVDEFDVPTGTVGSGSGSDGAGSAAAAQPPSAR